jgi:hypothetical protein
VLSRKKVLNEVVETLFAWGGWEKFDWLSSIRLFTQQPARRKLGNPCFDGLRKHKCGKSCSSYSSDGRRCSIFLGGLDFLSFSLIEQIQHRWLSFSFSCASSQLEAHTPRVNI